MANEETKAWAEKSKRVEAERLKAAADLESRGGGEGKVNLAYLDPQATKVEGWSRDPNVILASIERMGNRAMALAIAGVVLMMIGEVGGEVSFVNKLGMAGALVSGLPTAAGGLCMGAAVLMAGVAIGGEIFWKVRHKRKLGTSFWTGVGAIVVVAGLVVVRMVVLGV